MWSAHWAGGDACEACDQPIYSVARRFKAFLATYANAGKSAQKLYRTYYTIRSNILHAGEFLKTEALGLWHEDALEELDTLSSLSDAVRIAMINWLRDPLCSPVQRMTPDYPWK